MAYRETPRTRARAEHRRARIERAAHQVIASGGFESASIAAVAREAECSAGLIYTYYENRDELLGIVFAHAAGHELAVVEAAIGQTGDAGGLVDAVTEVFIRRAVIGRALAHALLLEDVPSTVQIERRALRRGYVSAIASRLEELSTSEIPAEVVARSLVGSISENLVDVLDPERSPPNSADVESLIAALSTFARTAIGEQ
ncbi:TetR family transcriptional regulator [Brevibacterium sp. UCMA 11752]|uniref:TetR family transcriptional regulator n=1 Tax=Brevibacterium sp. UCMA 11752 TaxID=2745946 RepID=UPI001F1EC847|nr:TetR/AcrR family transcriptional regulator [Brevibacterium sp. UCMA 11752]MCF2587320.1 TetR/AcrR family transcriptional regulator [Brevibacterium sp. UCMA 11752]